MLMFLRCLQFFYPTGLIQRVGKCWNRIRFAAHSEPEYGLRLCWRGVPRHCSIIFTHGFWTRLAGALSFRQPSEPYIFFKKTSVQAMYYAPYLQIRDVQIDFIRLDHVRQ